VKRRLALAGLGLLAGALLFHWLSRTRAAQPLPAGVPLSPRRRPPEPSPPPPAPTTLHAPPTAHAIPSWAPAAAGVALLAGALAAYYAWSEELPDVSLWWEVVIVGGLVIPAAFGLVGLALPLRRERLLPVGVLALAGVAALLEWQELGTAASFVKLAVVSGAGWFFLRFFEEVTWVLLVAILIIPVDIYSVARGPTKQILEEKPEIFDRLSVAFPIPGEHAAAQLGLPDVLFFALFVGAADRFGLRTRLTWLACTLSFGATLALSVGFDLSGLPALPLLSAGFVLANADLVWRRLRLSRRRV
jgi:hypothetical protein